MIYDTYKIFVKAEGKKRLLELIESFDELPNRVVKEEGRPYAQGIYTRLILNLSSEEATVIKLSLGTNQCVVIKFDGLINKPQTMFDSYVELCNVLDVMRRSNP